MKRTPAFSLWWEACGLLQTHYFGYDCSIPRLKNAILRVEKEMLAQLRGKSVQFEDIHPYIEKLIRIMGDKHTTFHSQFEFAQLMQRYSNTVLPYPDFGIELGTINSRQEVLISEVYANSLAADLGIQRFDRIQAVNGRYFSSTPQMQNFLNALPVADLQLARGDYKNHMQYNVSLSAISGIHKALPYLYVYYPQGINLRLYVLRIPTFVGTKKIAPEVHRLVSKVQKLGAGALVIDLRDNEGGSELECYGAASAFIARATNVNKTRFYTKEVGFDGWRCLDNPPKEFKRYDIEQPALWEGELVVLINRQTNSCGEIMAQLLQRNNFTILGEVKHERYCQQIEYQGGLLNTTADFWQLADKSALQITYSRTLNTQLEALPNQICLPNENIFVDNKVQIAELGFDPMLEQAYKSFRRS